MKTMDENGVIEGRVKGKALLRNGSSRKKERLAEVIDRLGIESFRQQVWDTVLPEISAFEWHGFRGEGQQAAHPYGRARGCASCHRKDGLQVSNSRWEFMDDQGATPFKGTHRIVAGKDGLRIEDLKNMTPVVPVEGARLADFAAWLYMKDKWKAPGDFSIKTDPLKYREALRLALEAGKRIGLLEKNARHFDKEKLIRFKRLKESVFHNPRETAKYMEQFR